MVNSGTTSLMVSWGAISEAISYDITVLHQGQVVINRIVSDPEFNIEELQSFTNYTVIVKGIDALERHGDMAVNAIRTLRIGTYV